VLKDHWRHPRPRDVMALGGALHYVPSPLIGRQGGASFPCGHCTVGFLYGVGWWIWRRRRPRWAAASLATGLLAGTLLGVGRMAAGAHFLSDVIWSALLAYGVTHVLSRHLLRLDEAAVAVSPGEPEWRPGARGVAALCGGAAVLLALFVLPHGTDLDCTVPLTADSPRTLVVIADRANLSIVLLDAASSLRIEGELHGFGLPGAHLGARIDTVSQPAPALRYRIEARGWLTDVDGFATLYVPGAAFERIRVHTDRGDVRVRDNTRAGVVGAGRVTLELSTDRGTVQAPPVPP
jgi:lipid A 4'-phosphatase